MFFLLLFLSHILPPITAPLPHPVCSSAPSITFRGSNDVTRNGGGGPSLVVFGPLQCANCYAYLRRLNDIASQRNFRIIVVAPDFESNHIISRTSTAFPNLQIDRAGEGWPRYQAANFDAMILDSCGKVTETLSWPNSDVTSSSTVLQALDNANSKCGKCRNPGISGNAQGNIGNPGNPNPRGGLEGTSKKVNAYLKEHERKEYSRSRSPQTPQIPQQQYQNQQQNTYYQQYQPQNQQNPQNQGNTGQFYNQNPQNPQIYHQQHQQPPQNQQQNYQNHQYQYQYQNQVQNPNQNGQNYGFYTPPPPPPPPIPTKEMFKATTTEEPIDYDYYPNDDVATTQSTQTQIPRPPSSYNANQNWPTLSPYQQQSYQNQYYNGPQYQNQYQGQNGNPKNQYQPLPLMDANLPCSAFTDDICYQQQERSGGIMPKCCNKGVYLTDVCVPGKCSNSTTQLCCFQKFLQAKYSCCNDPLQDEGAPKMTNMFNKCCHNLFVTEDPCCPDAAARRYWTTAYEVCMPTVTVDFSPVKFEVHFTEGVRVLDLSTDRQWDFNCTYGKKRPQFAYLPVNPSNVPN